MNLIIVIQLLMLCVGLYFVIKGADVLLSSATALGKTLKVSDFFIGLNQLSLEDYPEIQRHTNLMSQRESFSA